MSKDIYELMKDMPAHVRERFQAFDERPVPAPREPVVVEQRVEDEWEVVTVEPVEPARPVKVEPSIYSERGDELAVWRNRDGVDVVLNSLSGFSHYGRLVAPLLAEGGFHASESAADREFKAKVYGAVVKPDNDALSRGERQDPEDPNYAHRATCLWTNRDRTGAPHAHAFLVVTWSGRGAGAFPIHALLMDGDRLKEFDLQRQKVTNHRQPQWKGRAK